MRKMNFTIKDIFDKIVIEVAAKKYKFAEMSKTQLHFILALASGIFLGIAWPTYGFTFLIFGALVPLLYLENSIRKDKFKRKGLRVFAYSYLSFLIWNLITTWWLVNSTFIGMTFANLCNSLFFALLFLLFYWSKGRLPQKSAYLFFIALWLAFEKLHLSWDFSWSWLNLGNVFSEKIFWIQWYEYTGTFGGSLWVLIINIWIYNRIKNSHTDIKTVQFVSNLIPPLLGIALPIVFSLLIYKSVKEVEPTLNIVLHQPNIDPYETKYNLTNTAFLAQFKEQLKPYINTDTDYILSPETYFAEGYGESLDHLESSALFQKIQKELVAYPKLKWITGIQLYNLYEQKNAPSLTANKVKPGLWVDYYNSALGVQSRQKAQIYHKSKLVVGIENMPFKSILKPLLGDLLIDLGGTVSSRAIQEKRSVFSNPITESRTGPIICWESVFGEFVTDYIKNGAEFLAVITNDAWWGNTPGHKQLLSYTRLRAIETRRAIARSANTGISAFINARGEIIQQTDYNTKTVLQGSLAPRTEITFYVQYGDIIARWAGFITLLFLLLAISGRLKAK